VLFLAHPNALDAVSESERPMPLALSRKRCHRRPVRERFAGNGRACCVPRTRVKKGQQGVHKTMSAARRISRLAGKTAIEHPRWMSLFVSFPS
jgi:hypothetical protein